jgi:hypothetical protein
MKEKGNAKTNGSRVTWSSFFEKFKNKFRSFKIIKISLTSRLDKRGDTSREQIAD